MRVTLSNIAKKLKTIKISKLLFIAVFALLVGVCSSNWAVKHAADRNNDVKQEHQAALEEAMAQERAALEKAEIKAEQETRKSETEHGEASDPEVIKYATSSDPRSTAYSTTPPKPNPKSFSIKITHNGQVAPYTMLFYNATKNERGYYGGDLVVSPSTITISRSAPAKANIIISASTGNPVYVASMPWDDQSPHFFVAYDSAAGDSAAPSQNMFVDTYDMPPAGTYKLHITTGCGQYKGDEMRCDFFITVKVVD